MRYWGRQALVLVMPIGNQKFGIPRKYQYQIDRYFVFLSKFLGIFLVFYRNLVFVLLKIWFNICIFRQNKNRFGTLVSICILLGWPSAPPNAEFGPRNGALSPRNH